MTSLSDQLKKLRVPQAAVFKEGSKRGSLLFGPAEARGYGVDQLIALGQRGLKDLLAVDDGFAPFKDTLFANSSIDIERSVLSKKENDKLNASITKFLYRLTPYFLLTGAHQALEWLIHKFRIHEFNREELLLSALPHHDSIVFVKVVQLCWSPDIDQSHWHWLDNIRKAGTPLSRERLLNYCCTNLNFLQLIVDTTFNAREVLQDDGRSMQLLYSFYVSIVCGLVSSCGKVTDAIVGRLLPYIGEGMKSKNPSLIVSSCMIVCQLATKVVLTSSACEALLTQTLLAMIEADTAVVVLPTAAVLCQTEPTNQLPSKSMKKIVRRMNETNAWAIMSKLEQRYDLDKLVGIILNGLVDKIASTGPEKRSIYEKAIHSLMENVTVAPGISVSILRRIFGHCSHPEYDKRMELETVFRPVAVSIGEKLRECAIQKTSSGNTNGSNDSVMENKRKEDLDERMSDEEEMEEEETPLQFLEVTADTFRKLPVRKQQDKLAELLESLRLSERSKAVGAKEALRRIHLPPTILERTLQNALGKPEATPRKKRRTSGAEVWHNELVRRLEPDSLTTIRDLLELFLDAGNTKGMNVLVAPLFTILKKCLFAEDEGSEMYVAQLCMAALVKIFEDSGTKTNNFDVDVLVQCIQSTASPRLHQYAFKLLSVAAHLFKEDLIVRVMPIFSFMGRGLLRQDDSYTFEVIHNAVENVIPPLITGSKNPLMTMTNVLRDFVISVPHIPEHRRIVLLKKVVSVASKCQVIRRTDDNDVDVTMAEVSHEGLWMLIGLMIEHHVTDWDKEEQSQENASPYMDFILRLCWEFPPSDQLYCLIALLRYIDQLPDVDDNSSLNKQLSSRLPRVFDPSAHSNKQLRHFKYEVVSLCSHLLSSSGFVGKVAETTEGSSLPAYLVSLFEKILEQLLSMYERSVRVNDAGQNQSAKKYWRLFIGRVERSVEQITALLPASVSLSVIGGLLSRDSVRMKRRALELLNARLHNPSFEEQHVEQLIILSDTLTSWLDLEPNDKEAAVLGQCALYSLKLLIRAISPFKQDSFKTSLDRVSAILNNWRGSDRLYVSSAALCLGEIVECAGVDTVSALPRFGKDLVDILSDETTWAENDLMLISGLTATQKILHKLADFCGPYLPDLLKAIARISAMSGSISGQFKSQIQHRISNIRDVLSAFPGRIIQPALEKSFQDLAHNPSHLPFVFLVLNDHIRGSSSSEVASSQSHLMSLFLSFFDLRSTSVSEVPPSETNRVEDECITAFLSMALKISENNFRPIIFKLVEWASKERPDRMITLTRLSSRLYDTFRGLFNLFAAPIVSLAAEVLRKGDPLFVGEYAEDKTVLLYSGALDTIAKCCQFDTHGFVSRDRFDAFSEALLEQLEQCSLTTTRKHLLERVSSGIAYATDAIKDDSAFKSLNYQLLMKTRHPNPEVRMTTLNVLENLYGRMGNESTTVVAETVPFLADLLEDENEDVAVQCEKVIKKLESIIGDSLREYF